VARSTARRQAARAGLQTLPIPLVRLQVDAHMTLQELRTTRRMEILQLAAKRGASNVRVFGSVARGESDEKSDVDFLVDLEPGRTLFDLSGLLLDLERVLEASVDVVTERGLRPRVRARVLAEAVKL
jgi:predicted nucleotidyltransferase